MVDCLRSAVTGLCTKKINYSMSPFGMGKALDVLLLCELRGDHRQVQTILTTLRKDGHHPAKESYTLLLSSLIASGRIQEGPSLLQQMHEDKVVPDAIFFNTLLNGYCEAGDIAEAEALFKQMKETGCLPITSTFNTLIKGYGLAGKPEKAMKLLQEMGKEEDSKPNDRTFNMLINVWARQKNPEEARYVISLMRASGIPPDVVSYNTLAQVFFFVPYLWKTTYFLSSCIVSSPAVQYGLRSLIGELYYSFNLL